MMQPDLLSSGYGEAFKALQYVTNPYALAGLLLLVLVVALSWVRGIAPKLRFFVLTALAVLVVLVTGFLLQYALDSAKSQTLTHLVRHGNSVALGSDVSIELLDIETLKGSKDGGHTFNKSLADIEHILLRVVDKAGIPNVSTGQLMSMTDEAWGDLLANLEPIKAESVKDIPFARFAVFCGQRELSAQSSRYFFKGEILAIREPDCGPLTLRIENIYNTKHATSGEREAVNLRLETKSGGVS